MIKSIQINWLIGTYVQLRLSTSLRVLSILTLRQCLAVHHANATPHCVKTVLRCVTGYRVCPMAYNTWPLAFKPAVRNILRMRVKPKEKSLRATLYIIPLLCNDTINGGTRWRSWLRHSATNRKVMASILDGVIVIFHWHNHSGRTSTRNISWE